MATLSGARVSVAWPMAGILSGVLVLTTGAVPSEAQFRRPPMSRQHEQGHLRAELGLSDDQVQAIRVARDQHWAERQRLGRSMLAARTSLRQLVLQGADAAALQAKAAEIAQLQSQELQLRIKGLQEFSQILTPEQRVRLLQLPRRFPRRGQEGETLPSAG